MLKAVSANQEKSLRDVSSAAPIGVWKVCVQLRKRFIARKRLRMSRKVRGRGIIVRGSCIEHYSSGVVLPVPSLHFESFKEGRHVRGHSAKNDSR